MDIYTVNEIQDELEQIASENMGEVPEEKLQALVLAKTEAVEQIDKLVKYIRYCEFVEANADAELERIATIKRQAQNRQESIKRYLMPFIKKQPKSKMSVGTFNLSIRKSAQVIVDNNELDKDYLVQKITYSPDKLRIKADLSKGMAVKGAGLVEFDNLQIK